jgi:Flp pilus assembly pilin Flp
MIEYALIVGIVAMLAVGAVASFGTALTASFQSSGSQLQQALGS